MSIRSIGCRQEPLFFSPPDQVPRSINPDLDLKPAPDFFQLPSGHYTSLDPRLISDARQLRLAFDRAAVQPVNVQPLRNIYSAPLPPIQAQYKSYKDITLGNVSTQYSPFKSQVFPAPNYQIPSNTHALVFTDPMGSVKAYYLRNQIQQQPKTQSNYSFDQDQMTFREDIMSRQSQLIDRSDFTKFYSFFPEKERHFDTQLA